MISIFVDQDELTKWITEVDLLAMSAVKYLAGSSQRFGNSNSWIPRN